MKRSLLKMIFRHPKDFFIFLDGLEFGEVLL